MNNLDVVQVGQFRQHPVLGKFKIRDIFNGMVFVESASGHASCYYETTVASWKLV